MVNQNYGYQAAFKKGMKLRKCPAELPDDEVCDPDTLRYRDWQQKKLIARRALVAMQPAS